jgi:hypothetical protein
MEGQKALVPYKGDGSIVLYQEFGFAKKHKPRPKVDLDPETERTWKLLMGKEESEDLGGTDKEKEKWWEEERNVFRGRADSFIARMHLVQGTKHQIKGPKLADNIPLVLCNLCLKPNLSLQYYSLTLCTGYMIEHV